jgi:hypothetical protein
VSLLGINEFASALIFSASFQLTASDALDFFAFSENVYWYPAQKRKSNGGQQKHSITCCITIYRLVYLFDYFRWGPRGTWHRSFWMSPSMKRSESARLVTSVKKKNMFTHAPFKIKLSSYTITHVSLRAETMLKNYFSSTVTLR